jgi:asparagine synthase (glutamine-hydrolysing)
MAHSIEVRAPFLDYRLIEWAARLPRATLLNQHQGKLPLRTLGARLLPPQVQRGYKRGFAVPLQTWFREKTGQGLVRERLISTNARPRGLWNPRGIETLLAAHQSPASRDFGFIFWRVLVLDAWARHYLDAPIRLERPAWAASVV